MGFYIVLRDAKGAQVQTMTDAFGLTFDAAGDFDELIDARLSPQLAAIDPYATTTIASSSAAALGPEVDLLLASVPERARGTGLSGQAWRGLSRFRIMLDLCQTDHRSTLEFVGD